MKSENVTVLGFYKTRGGGSIQLFIGPNMEFGTEHTTQVHEMYHMHLTNMTTLGSIISIFELERVMSEELDMKQSNRIKKFIDIMSERALEVHEVYANNMELLWIRENIGPEFERKAYNSKTMKYQNYCDTLKIITEDKTMNTLEKQQHIELICMYAMNIDSLLTEFIDSLRNDRLSQFFNNERHPSQRLKKAIIMYNQGKLESLSGHSAYDINKFAKQIQLDGILKHLDWTEVLKEYNKAHKESGEIKNIISLYNDRMEESIQAFDLSAINVFRDPSFSERDSVGLFSIKECANLDDAENNFYLIDHIVDDGKSKYISEESSKKSTMKLIQNRLCVAIPLREYDLNNNQPRYLESIGKLVIVLFEEYQECDNWLTCELSKGEVYIGDLYDESVNNFFTVLFFARRNNPDTIFVFPTIKRLGKKLIEKNKLSDRVLYSNQKEFLKIFSYLSNEANMLKVIHWFMVFLTNTKGEFSSLQDSAIKLSFDFTRTLMNTVFQIKQKNYYRQLAALPTLWTEAQPFYAVMEFKGKHNTGDIITVTKQDYPLFFISNQDAVEYLRYNPSLDDFRIVGIDRHYWNEIKPFLLRAKKRICFFVYLKNRQRAISVAEILNVDKLINQ
ncbi:hypothetical protein GCM10008014_51250 [Paenibacillus silvae]|uniref:Uncharacterized protein n=1 Tax=Paenibacillus silvae TaxID=1325358 RepID=A0ABQ1ZJ50_9BACL|nr:hypothetical protein [Paenibacillus silvae]GGH68632.1 hypothetical protein GCM10008014_51250 [Paenibacillus silvae]